jgi:alpha-D-ribose 1-methylphosphonate 5-triphosphate synthase subunit PhnH
MSGEVAALLLTLTDSDTPVWLTPDLDCHAVRQWLAFHSGCPVVTDPARAMFAVASSGGDHGYVRVLDPGTAEYPDRAATLILALPGLVRGHPLTLAGPGIEGEMTLAIALPEAIVGLLAQNTESYPLGIDILLAAPGVIVGLPRSTRIVHAEAS